MFVEFLGFEIQADPNIPPSLLFERLERLPPEKMQDVAKQHFVLKTKHVDGDKFRNSVLISERSGKEQFKLSTVGGKRLLQPTTGEDSNQCNFFIFNKTNSRGLYQEHRGSISLRVFGEILNHYYNILRKELATKEAEAKIPDPDKRTKKISNLLKTKYCQPMKLIQIVSHRTFSELLESMQTVTSLELDANSLTIAKNPFVSMEKHVRSKSLVYEFEKLMPMGKIKRAINRTLGFVSPRWAVVKGRAALGAPTNAYFGQNFERYAKLDFDTISHEMIVDMDSFETTKLFDRLHAFGNKDTRIAG